MDQKAPRYFAIFSAAAAAGMYLHFLARQVIANLFPDFSCYYVYSTLLNQGYSLWGKGVNPLILKKISLLFSSLASAGPNLNLHHSPAFYLLMTPFTWLDLKAASIAWIILCQAALAAGLWLFAKAAGRERDPFFLAACAFIAFFFRPLYVNASLGSIHYLSIFLAAAAMRCYMKGARGRAGTLIGVLAVTNEIFFPLLLLPLFKRQWKALGYAVGTILLLHATALWLFGGRIEAEYWRYILSSWHSAPFPAQERLVSIIPARYALWAVPLAGACMAVVLYRAVRRGTNALREFSLFLCASLVVSPFVTGQHLLILILPLAACWEEIYRKPLATPALLALLSYLAMGAEHPPAMKAAGYLLLFYLMLTLTTERKPWKQ